MLCDKHRVLVLDPRTFLYLIRNRHSRKYNGDRASQLMESVRKHRKEVLIHADSTFMKEVSSISTEFDDLGEYFSLKNIDEGQGRKRHTQDFFQWLQQSFKITLLSVLHQWTLFSAIEGESLIAKF